MVRKKKFVYHAVHMIFGGDFAEEWDEDEERVSKLVFIGKNLDHEELKREFVDARFDEDAFEEQKRNLRFKVGDEVTCNATDGWADGVVVKQMYRSEFMPPGFVAPYQIKLTNGTLIYAPMDTDELIKKRA